MFRIGIDLGGTKAAVGLVNENHEIVSTLTCPTGGGKSADEITGDIASLTLSLLKENRIDRKAISFLGLAAPGTVIPETGLAKYFCNLPFVNYPIGPKLAALTGIDRVLLENDANAAALGEAVAGCARDARDSVMITIGTGIGGGVIINRRLFTGFFPGGAELGHTVIVHGGRECGCGRRGCWEAYASVPALIRTTKEIMLSRPDSLLWKECGGEIDRVNSFTPFKAVRNGDEAAKEALDLYIAHLADGLTNIVNIFQPEILCLGGGLSGEPMILDPVREIVDRDQYTRNADRKTRIVLASLGNAAGIIGAASLGLDSI